jgi:16S rRNA (guanine527-N7)-methyltransferase
MSGRDTRSRLLRRAARADVPLPADLADRLLAFLDLLFRWNRKINLTAFQTPEEGLDRLLLEPLAAAKHVTPREGRLIDLGSGGGSPAIPLVLAIPALRLTMVEIKARKAAFLREAVRVLDLPQASVETTRYEELLTSSLHREAYTALSIRAVRIDRNALRDASGFLAPAGMALVFRGPAGPAELADAGPLSWTGTFPLLEPLQSRLSVLRKVA